VTTSTAARAPDKLRALHGKLETALAELVSRDEWAVMLTAAARFHPYSPANVVLILRQRPDATPRCRLPHLAELRPPGPTWRTRPRHPRPLWLQRPT
jgi:hypothetical protein